MALGVAAAVSSQPAMSRGLDLGPFELGGALRANLLGKSWETRERRFPRSDLEFDTARGRLGFEAGDWHGSAQYRFYYYKETGRKTHFLHHAWLGYRASEDREIRIGVHQVPFGNLPFNSHSYFFSLAYYLGLEDDYDLGARITERRGPWRFDAAWYFADEGSYFGDSDDSARYSYDVVESDASGNHERHQLNGRVARVVDHGELGESTFGVSLQAGRIPNELTGETGAHIAAALHYNGDFGPWNVKLESLWYDYDLENPAGTDDDVVVMGAYDFAYQVAARGMLQSIGVSYHWPLALGWLDGITAYENYSVLIKARDDFDDTHHNVIGMSFDASPVFVYADLVHGANNAWIGPDFGTALAAGDDDDDLNFRFNINVGVYF